MSMSVAAAQAAHQAIDDFVQQLPHPSAMEDAGKRKAMSPAPSPPSTAASPSSTASSTPASVDSGGRPRRRQRVSYSEVDSSVQDWDVKRLNDRMLKEAIQRSIQEAASAHSSAAATTAAAAPTTSNASQTTENGPAAAPSPAAADAVSADPSTAAEPVVHCEQSTCAGCAKPTLSDDPIPILICDKCEAEWHQLCINPPLTQLPAEDEEWLCPNCRGPAKRGRKKKDPGAAAPKEAKEAKPKKVAAAKADGAGSPAKGVMAPEGFEYPAWCASEAAQHRFSTMFAHYSKHYPSAPPSQIISTITAYWDDDAQQSAQSQAGEEKDQGGGGSQEAKESPPVTASSANASNPSPPTVSVAPPPVSLSTTIPSLPASATAAAAPPAAAAPSASLATTRALPSSVANDPESIYRLSYSVHQQGGGGTRRCHGVGCQKEEGDVLFSICGQCLVACYCSRDCQARHWKTGHKQECAQLGLSFQQKIQA